MIKPLFKTLNGAVPQSRSALTTLIYHRVLESPDPLRPGEVTAIEFEQHMQWISSVYNVLPLNEAVEGFLNNSLPPRALAITFDDGYRDNYTVALPILKKYGFLATVFCTTAFLDGAMMWNDKVIESVRRWPHATLDLPALDVKGMAIETDEQKRASVPKLLEKLKYIELEERAKLAEEMWQLCGDANLQLMMSADDIAALHKNGITIGGHTHAHPILASLDDNEAARQIRLNKAMLEDIVGESLTLFAYPNGRPGKDYNGSSVDIVREAGYRCAVTTSTGAMSMESDLFQIPRFTPWDKAERKFMARLLKNRYAVARFV